MNETPRFPSAPRRDGNGLEPGLRQGRNPAHRPCPRGVATGESRLLDAFRDGLSALGWTDGSNLSVLDRWAEERTEVLPALVKELIGSGVTILVTAGTSATLAATRANATIPIVLVGVDDPVSLGLVDTLMQPGGNVTGLSLSSSEVSAERLELLRQLVPGLHRLAVIVRDDPGLDQKLQDIRSNAQRMGIETLMLEATTAKAVELAFARLRSDRAVLRLIVSPNLRGGSTGRSAG